MKLSYQDSSQINQQNILDVQASLKPYIEQLQKVAYSHTYDASESSINLPSDAALLKTVLEMKQAKTTDALKYIIDIGIGGSNLGAKAVYDAFFGQYDVLEPNRFPKIIFLDTTNEQFLSSALSLINTIQNPNELIVNAISKSGGTTETIANLEIILDSLLKKFGEAAMERCIITTDEGSKLWEAADKQNIAVLPIPKQVGGRFSVFSAAGLFPLACCGVNIESLLKGAGDMKMQCIQETENPALISAAVTYNHSKKGKNISDSFFFLPQLESVGKWYRQLTGESLGKEHNLEGNIVHTGITPTVSIGSTDLHSVGQLYLGGPKDKITTFIYSNNNPSKIKVPSTLKLPLVQGIENKSPSEIMYAIREGVKAAYKKQGLPFMELAFENVNEYELGAFFQFKMIEIMYLGKLMNVNTFDQPHVELYKTETKKILGG